MREGFHKNEMVKSNIKLTTAPLSDFFLKDLNSLKGKLRYWKLIATAQLWIFLSDERNSSLMIHLHLIDHSKQLYQHIVRVTWNKKAEKIVKYCPVTSSSNPALK